MTNQQITPEEAEAVIALWSQQQMPLDAGPRLVDVAEALDIAPEQAQQLLEQVRVQREQQGWQGRTQRAANRHPLAKSYRFWPTVCPAFSVLTMTFFGLASLVWSAWSWQEWVSFPIPFIEKVELIAANAGLWALFVKWGRSVYQDVRRKCRSFPVLHISQQQKKS